MTPGNIIDLTSRYPLPSFWWRGVRSGPGDVTTYALHYIDDEGTVPGPDATQAEEIAYLDAIHRYHLAVGYGGFGYHLAAFASGRVYLCTPLNRWGANGLGWTDEVIGVLLVFVGHVIPPLSTREAAAKAVEYSDDTYVGRSPLRPTKGHGELVATSCPGDRWQEWVPNLRELTKEDEMTNEEEEAVLRLIQLYVKGTRGTFAADVRSAPKAKAALWAGVRDNVRATARARVTEHVTAAHPVGSARITRDDVRDEIDKAKVTAERS